MLAGELGRLRQEAAVTRLQGLLSGGRGDMT